MKAFKIPVLLWHSVEPDSPKYVEHANTPVSLFRDQMKLLAQNYTPISIFDFINLIEGKKSARSYAKPPVLLTFDDGFKDVVNHALPVIEEFKAPVLLFVIAGAIENPEFIPWFIEMKHLIRKTQKRAMQYDGAHADLTSHAGQRKLRRLFAASFEGVDSESARQSLVTDFARQLGINRPTSGELDEDLQLLTKDDLSNLKSPLLTIGSHAMTHRNLASLTREEQTYELKESHRILAENCRRYCPVVGYPAGSFNCDSIAIARDIYQAGFALYAGSSYRNTFAYPRISLARDRVQDLPYVLSTIRVSYLLPLKRFLYRSSTIGQR